MDKDRLRLIVAVRRGVASDLEERGFGTRRSKTLEMPPRPRPLALISTLVLTLLVTSQSASAQGVDLTLFLGAAFPTYDERLTLRPSIPSLPGVDVNVVGTPEIRTDGGLVFGGALAFELGIFGIEGRLDATELGFNLTGARYDLTAAPFQGLTGRIQVGDGRFDADRLYLLSLNARLRTPGPIGLVASGGLSYLPDVTITGSVPLSVDIAGLPAVPGLETRLQLQVTPGESQHRLGVNGGIGLRIGGQRVALMGEVRAFYFKDVELRFSTENAPQVLADLVDRLNPIHFEPVIVNAQAGLVFKF